MAKKENRKDVLLRACYKYLQANAGCLNEVSVTYDGADCDGLCLKDDIAIELGIEE